MTIFTTRIRQAARRADRNLGRALLVGVVLGAFGFASHGAANQGVEEAARAKREAAEAVRIPAIDGASELGKERGRAGEAEEGASPDAAIDWSTINYIPPSRGKARDTAAGGTRGLNSNGVSVAVLAPNRHVALTTRAQPTLYWFVSTDTDLRIDVTITDDEAIDPLLEMTVPAPVAAGIHAIDLASRGLTLEPGKVYQWNVAIVPDATRRAGDVLASGYIERTEVSPALERHLSEAPNAYAPYALSGIWYDAMDELRSARTARPADRRLRLQEVALLEQAQLENVARYAIESAGSPSGRRGAD